MNTSTKYSELTETFEAPIRAIYISSYIPRKCGIATFTKDLTTAINNQNPLALAEIVAMDDIIEGYNYPWEVKFHIKKECAEDYINAANYINQSSADIVNLQHEFGLFGGEGGDYILPMLDTLNKPVISVFHTVLSEPKAHEKYVMQRIIDQSKAIICLTKQSKEDIVNVYGCNDPDKITQIYHGVADFKFNDSENSKKKLKIKAENMILMSGLLSRGKGAEYVIEAMKDIVKVHPGTFFYLIGETHPTIVQLEGETYREELKSLVRKYKLTANVKFINKFMDLDELIMYFKACDFYITPHLDPQQGSSGTLSKAMAAGKVCLSTPYAYANEMLADDRGILFPFKDARAIAEAVIDIIDNPERKEMYENNAYRLGRLMQWPNVASKYLTLFRFVRRQDEKTGA